MICIGLQKALFASTHVSVEEAAYAHSGQNIVKKAFNSLTGSVGPDFGLPELLHDWGGSHLHSYIRVLGFFHDTDEILTLLQWIGKHQAELKAKAEASNDFKLLRRSLIAIRALFDDSEDIPENVVDCMKELVDQLEGWGGWPTAEEVDNYQIRQPRTI